MTEQSELLQTDYLAYIIVLYIVRACYRQMQFSQLFTPQDPIPQHPGTHAGQELLALLVPKQQRLPRH